MKSERSDDGKQPTRERSGLSQTYVGANHTLVRRSNRAMIFRAIRALGPIPRAELARRSHLNPATVTHIVDELLAARLVAESGLGTSRVGRRPVYLEVRPDARYAVGVDIARQQLTGAVVDLAGSVRTRLTGRSQSWPSGEGLLEDVSDLVERLLADIPASHRRRIVGIGIGAPGPVSIRHGRFLKPPTFAEWDATPLAERITRRFRIPTLIDNNANTSALAELWFGAAQGIDDFVLINLGTGVGSGLVLGGDLYRGDHDLAGETGHMSINVDGPRCACGNYGCLELYVSAPTVLNRMRNDLGDETLSLDDGFARAREGDPVALRILEDVAKHLAAATVSLVNTVDPDLVLIGRQLARADELLLEPMRRLVGDRLMPAKREVLRIERAALEDGPLIGAATLALRDFFRAPLGLPSDGSQATARLFA